MTLILSGTDGLSDVDGSAATPAIRGTDANTGIFFPAADTIAFAEGGAEAMRIDSSGNVGIGTSSPAGKLHVEGGSENAIIGSSTRKIYFRADSGGIGLLDGAVQTGNGFYVNGASSYVATFTGSTERARIDSSGRMLINTTTPQARLTVLDAGDWVIASIRTGTGGEGHIRFDNANGNVGYIQTTGTTTQYVTSSDYRLKNTIAPMTGALAKVALLKPCTYKWNVDGSDGHGFIAHELAEVEPGCVSGDKDAVDAEGNPKYQGIDTSFLVATLTAAIQEQQALITQLQADVAALKGQP